MWKVLTLPDRILPVLACTECGEYLSRSPVYMNCLDGKSICGNCVTSDEPVMRNVIYEEIAQFVKFPCKYNIFGCPLTVPFAYDNEEKPHELACKFRQFPCPIMNSSCNWLGTYNEILGHCYEKHNSNVISNTSNLCLNVKYSSPEHYIIPAHKHLFALRTEPTEIPDKYLYIIKCIGDPKNAENFVYTLIITQGNSVLTKSGDIVSEGSNIGESFNIDYLQKSAFTITINHKCRECGLKVIKYLYYDSNGWKCESCVPLKRACSNLFDGCSFLDFDLKCEGHENYHCNFTPGCWLCGKIMKIGTLHSHYIVEHGDDSHRGGEVFTVPVTSSKKGILLTDAGIAIFEYTLNNSVFKIFIVSAIESIHLKDYRCVVVMGNVNSNTSSTLISNALYDRIWDWCMEVKNDEYVAWNTMINMSIDIKKVEDTL